MYWTSASLLAREEFLFGRRVALQSDRMVGGLVDELLTGKENGEENGKRREQIKGME